MFNRFKFLLSVTIALLYWCSLAQAGSLEIDLDYRGAVGLYAKVITEADERLTPGDILNLHDMKRLDQYYHQAFFGRLGSPPLWALFEVENTGDVDVTRRFSIKNSWIDEIDIYLFYDGVQVRDIGTGDRFPYRDRPIPQRYFAFDHDFQPGKTTVVMRFATPDAFIVPVYFTTPEQDSKHQIQAGYGHGIIYGVIGALLIYNLILGISLKSNKYIYYSCYMGAFLAMNLTYTGHSYQILWPDFPSFQGFSIPVLMTLHVICGFLFAVKFLSISKRMPNLSLAIYGGCIIMVLTQIFAVFSGSQSLSIYLAFFFMLACTIGMIGIGFASLRMGERAAVYFLPACILGAGGAAITCITVMGMIPFNPYTYAAVDVGMTMEAILFAVALAKQMNQFKEDKLEAEKMARLDPLTGVSNRRGFFEWLTPIWNGIIRNEHTAAVILIDIDNFKSINDNYGHHVGDSVLIQVAKNLRKLTRNSDLLARWGGEEFIVFLPETDKEKANLVAERYRKAIEELCITIEGHDLLVTISAGVSQRAIHETSIDDLIVSADIRMLKAKELGKNRIVDSVLLEYVGL